MMSLQARRSSHHVFISVVAFLTSPCVFIFILMLNLCWGFSSQWSFSRRSGMAGVPSAAGLDVISLTFPWGQRWLEAAGNGTQHFRTQQIWQMLKYSVSNGLGECFSLQFAPRFWGSFPCVRLVWMLGGFALTRNLSGCSVVVSIL